MREWQRRAHRLAADLVDRIQDRNGQWLRFDLLSFDDPEIEPVLQDGRKIGLDAPLRLIETPCQLAQRLLMGGA